MSGITEFGKAVARGLGAFVQRRRAPVRAALAVATVAALAGIVIGYRHQASRVFVISGQPSPETIRAPYTTTYIDERATAQLRRSAEERVTAVEVVQPEIIARAENEVERLFAVLASPESRGENRHDLGLPDISPSARSWAAAQPPDRLSLLADPAKEIVRRVMRERIPADEVEQARDAVTAAAQDLDLAPLAREVVAAIGRRVVAPNLGYDAQATESLRRRAVRSVRPVQRTIVAGEVILRRGDIATPEDIDALRALGLMGPLPSLSQVISIGILCALAVLGLAGYVRRQQPEVYQDTRLLLLTALIGVLALFTVNLVNQLGGRADLISMLSVTAGVMTIAVLVGNRIALMVAVVESLLVGVMAQGQLAPAMLTFGSSLTGLLLVRHIWPTSRLVGACLMLGAVNVALVLLMTVIAGSEHFAGAATQSLWARLETFARALGDSRVWHGLFYGLGAPVIAVGSIFLLQRPFDITTHLRLIELANPNEPLLRRMLVEAPGTYSDSFLVANLAEAGAEAVGADGLLARVGSYYHDIGKLRRPYLFGENQALLGIGNVHEQMTPSLSSLVITSHVKDGVELAREYGLPRVLRDIIAQHHGTALVSFFYHQARTDARGQHLPEESFRYPGPKPQSREAAIIMLADAIFAAVWSLPDKTPARIEAVVRQLARDRLEDGQLDECPLTLRDLSAIIDAFLRLLKSIIFHTRVEYPQLAQLETRRPGGYPGDNSS